MFDAEKKRHVAGQQLISCGHRNDGAILGVAVEEHARCIHPNVREDFAASWSSQRSSGQWGQRDGTVPEPVSIDVLIPTCNRPAELAVTLAGLAAQTDPGFRVIISDQSSDEPAWQHPAAAAMVRVLQAQGREVACMRHLPRRGMAEHRQFLSEQSQADKTLFLDDDVWLEPGTLDCMGKALDQLGCGFVGMAPQGLSYLNDRRPDQTQNFEMWEGSVKPERVRPNTPAFNRWPLHSAANLSHLSADLDLMPGEWVPYRVAWVGGCVMYRRQALQAAGGFSYWDQLPSGHCGEDVVTQWQVMEKFGAAGILPSGAVHLESPTTLPDRSVEAHEHVLDTAGVRGNSNSNKETNDERTRAT